MTAILPHRLAAQSLLTVDNDNFFMILVHLYSDVYLVVQSTSGMQAGDSKEIVLCIVKASSI